MGRRKYEILRGLICGGSRGMKNREKRSVKGLSLDDGDNDSSFNISLN